MAQPFGHPLEGRVRRRHRLRCQAAPSIVCILDYLYAHMRTNIVIDDKLMADTLRATGLRTKREVVELGLKTLLQLRRQAEIRKLRGKITWEGDLDAMRRDK